MPKLGDTSHAGDALRYVSHGRPSPLHPKDSEVISPISSEEEPSGDPRKAPNPERDHTASGAEGLGRADRIRERAALVACAILFLLIVALAVTERARAEEDADAGDGWPLCSSYEEARDFLKGEGLVPLGGAPISTPRDGADALEIWVHDDGRWSALLRWRLDDGACLLANGYDWQHNEDLIGFRL